MWVQKGFRNRLISVLPFTNIRSLVEFSTNDLRKQFFYNTITLNNKENFLKKLSIPSFNYNLFSYSAS